MGWTKYRYYGNKNDPTCLKKYCYPTEIPTSSPINYGNYPDKMDVYFVVHRSCLESSDNYCELRGEVIAEILDMEVILM